MLSILPHSSAAWNVFGNGRGWLNECWYEKLRALVCNFGILSWLKSSCVYLFNIHLEPGTINSAPPKPFKNKEPVRKIKCEQLTQHSAFRLIWKDLCCPLACLLYPNTPHYFALHTFTLINNVAYLQWAALPAATKTPKDTFSCLLFIQQHWWASSKLGR